MKKQNCEEESGKLVPLIDLNKCEGKTPCVPICPYNVLEIREINDEQYAQLSFAGKIKTFFNGKKKAFVAKPDACHACGLCVSACPEKAIKLVKKN